MPLYEFCCDNECCPSNVPDERGGVGFDIQMSIAEYVGEMPCPICQDYVNDMLPDFKKPEGSYTPGKAKRVWTPFKLHKINKSNVREALTKRSQEHFKKHQDEIMHERGGLNAKLSGGNIANPVVQEEVLRKKLRKR